MMGTTCICPLSCLFNAWTKKNISIACYVRHVLNKVHLYINGRRHDGLIATVSGTNAYLCHIYQPCRPLRGLSFMEFNVPSNQLVTMPIIKCLGQYSLYFCEPSHGITTLSILYVASDLVFMATPSHSPPLPKMLYKPFSLSQYYSPFLSIVHVKEGEIDQEKWGASSFARTCFFCWL